MKPGTSYELLTRSLFQDMLNQSTARTITIEHDVVLRGATTDHQLDVYWTFEVGGIVYQTVVQAKDWNHRVRKGELLKFDRVLADLPGQPRGVFVTRSGYQRGAEEVARARGILLYQLDEARPPRLQIVVGGWANFQIVSADGSGDETRRIFAKVIVFKPSVNLTFHVERDWLEEAQLRLGDRGTVTDIMRLLGVPLRLTEIRFYDSEDKPVCTAQDISAR